jgi:hypothetical protein
MTMNGRRPAEVAQLTIWSAPQSAPASGGEPIPKRTVSQPMSMSQAWFA